MKLLDFLNAEYACCQSCKWGGGEEKPFGVCAWENKYPEEYAYALWKGWIEEQGALRKCHVVNRRGYDFLNQLMGDFT